MTVAQLGLAVDSSSVSAATPALDRMTAASQKAEVAAAQLGRASSGASAGVHQLEASAARAAMGMNIAHQNVRQMGGSFSGLAAQFQDVGVTAAAGMNPMLIALQQGSQIAGALEMAMASGAKASSVFAQAFASLLSPVSLAAIALTAVAAAGLQMVDWVKVAKGALNLLADNLVMIAPYAVAAAGALTLLYAPAIIAGIGSVATAIWSIGAAILGTIGLPALLIAGFIALAAAAVTWRDDLARILGVDLVGAVIDTGNKFIGVFVGTYNAIKQAWSNLPTFFSALGKEAWNNFLSTFEKDALTLKGPGGFEWNSGIKFDLSGMKATQTKAEADAMKDATGTFNQAYLSTNYLGNGVKFVQGAASGAADALRGIADTLKDKLTPEQKKALKESERQKKAYDDITLSAHQKIAAAQLEVRTLGMTTEQINAQRYAQELMNKAANDNIKLTPKQVDELTGLGAAMAAAEAAAKRMVDVYEFGKETFRGFFADLGSGIEQGKGLWASLADAGVNALQRIADKALSMAADGIWDMIFGAVKGSLFGGGVSGFGALGNDIGPGATFGGVQALLRSANGNVFASPGLHAYANQVVTQPTIFPFAMGAGLMGEAGAEAIMPLRRGADGRLGVQAMSGAAGNDNIRIALEVSVRDDGKLAVIARQEGGRAAQVVVNQTVPGMIKSQAPAAVAAAQRDRMIG